MIDGANLAASGAHIPESQSVDFPMEERQLRQNVWTEEIRMNDDEGGYSDGVFVIREAAAIFQPIEFSLERRTFGDPQLLLVSFGMESQETYKTETLFGYNRRNER